MMRTMPISEDLTRYHRQMILPGIGEDGQRRLLESTACVLGCGALGTVIADLLARAGVGHLVIVDRDFIETTNLQRQTLFDEDDIADGIPKAEAARRRLAKVNSAVRVTAVVDDLNRTNIARYASGADVLVDGLDNFEGRYLINDFAVKHCIPYIYGGAVGTVGAAFAILPHTRSGDAPWETLQDGNRAGPCLRCLFEEEPVPGTMPTCDTAGILASAAVTVASFEVAETLKVLTGNYEHVCPTMLNVDLWSNSVAQLGVSGAYEHGDCPCCKHGRYEYLEGSRGSGATTLCGRDAVQLTHRQSQSGVDLEEIAGRLRAHGEVRANRFMLRANVTDHGNSYILSLFPDGRAIVHGTAEAAVARGIYAKFIGA